MKYILIFLILNIFVSTGYGSKSMNTIEKKELTTETKNNPTTIADNVFKYLIDTLTVIALFAGIIVGFPAIRKKLREDHIIKLLEDTQKANKKTKAECYKLLDKYLNHIESNSNITKVEVETIFNEISKLNNIALNSSKEVFSFTFYLKSTIRRVLKDFDDNKKQILKREHLVGLIINTLQKIIFFSEKILTIPNDHSTRKVAFLKKEFEKYVTNNRYKRFKYFEQGLDNNPASPLFISFFGELHNYNSIILHKSAYKIYSSPIPMARVLFFYKIYYPLIFEMDTPAKAFGFDMVLYLISFEIKKLFLDHEENVETVIFTYANISDRFSFIEHLEREKFDKTAKDTYIASTGIDYKDIKSFTKGENECVQIEIEYEFAKKLFELNRKKLKRKMKSELK